MEEEQLTESSEQKSEVEQGQWSIQRSHLIWSVSYFEINNQKEQSPMPLYARAKGDIGRKGSMTSFTRTRSASFSTRPNTGRGLLRQSFEWREDMSTSQRGFYSEFIAKVYQIKSSGLISPAWTRKVSHRVNDRIAALEILH